MNASCRGIAAAHPDGGLLALAGAAARCLFRQPLNLMFGCWHRHKSFPFTPVLRDAPPGAPRNCTYMVCLDCGATFDYDWDGMRMGSPVTAHAPIDARPTRARA